MEHLIPARTSSAIQQFSAVLISEHSNNSLIPFS